MATKKISELEAITEADDSDVLAIVDVSEGKTNKITKNNLLIGAGHSIEMSLNQETYALTLTLKNAAGTELSTASIDLPNENAITNIEYSNGKLTLTKQSGTTTEVDISGLIEGLATETALTNLANALKETIGIQTNTYDNTKTYNTGDIVVQNEKIYKANQDNITGTFDSSKWDEISLYEYQKLQDKAIEENYKVITKLQEDVEDLTERMEDAENNQLTKTPTPATSHYLQDSADSRFRKFIPIGRTTQSNLPEGYTQLDYITSDGSSYIDTGIVLGKNYKVDVKFVNNVSRNDEQPIVSIWTASTNWWNLFINSSGVLDFYAKGHNYLDEVTIGEEQNINIIRDENNTTVIKNGQSFTIPVSYTETNNTTLKILKRGDNQGDSRASILSVNVYNDNILVGNFVPCKDVSNKIGLYDLVTKTFFANAGTGTFTAGDVSVPTPETPIPIKNTGDNVNKLSATSTNGSNTNLGVTLNYKTIGEYALIGTASNHVSLRAGQLASDYTIKEKDYLHLLNNTVASGVVQIVGLDTNASQLFAFTIDKAYKIIDLSNYAGSTLRYLQFLVTSGVTVNMTLRPMIINGVSVATPYSPYGCGNVNEKIENKNKFDSEDWYNTLHNINNNAISKETINGIEYYKFKRANETVGKYPYMKGKFKENTQYVISARALRYNNEATSTGFSIHYTDGTFQDTYIRETIEYDYIVISQANKTIDYICLSYANSYSALIRNIQLEQGSTATSYVPHAEQNPSFPLSSGQKFYEGSHPDDDEKVHHKWGGKVLDGTEPWKKSSYFDGSYYFYPKDIGLNYKEYCQLKCSHAVFASSTADYKVGTCLSDSSIGLWLLPVEQLPTTADFKAYLAEQYANGTPVIVVFELAEEQTEDFTEEQKTAWEEWKKARTYKNITHISSEDETPANVEIEYVRDINTIDDRITALEAKVDLLEE